MPATTSAASEPLKEISTATPVRPTFPAYSVPSSDIEAPTSTAAVTSAHHSLLGTVCHQQAGTCYDKPTHNETRESMMIHYVIGVAVLISYSGSLAALAVLKFVTLCIMEIRNSLQM